MSLDEKENAFVLGANERERILVTGWQTKWVGERKSELAGGRRKYPKSGGTELCPTASVER
jgi:hypothetical protein